MKERNEDIERLLSILKTCHNKKGYDGKKNGVRLIFSNLKASSSGMSRTFTIHVINKKGDMLNLTWLVSKILNDTYTKNDTMRVYGCGMDMLFETCYQLNCKIEYYKHGKYNHDKAYHGYVDTHYDLI